MMRGKLLRSLAEASLAGILAVASAGAQRLPEPRTLQEVSGAPQRFVVFEGFYRPT